MRVRSAGPEATAQGGQKTDFRHEIASRQAQALRVVVAVEGVFPAAGVDLAERALRKASVQGAGDRSGRFAGQVAQGLELLSHPVCLCGTPSRRTDRDRPRSRWPALRAPGLRRQIVNTERVRQKGVAEGQLSTAVERRSAHASGNARTATADAGTERGWRNGAPRRRSPCR